MANGEVQPDWKGMKEGEEEALEARRAARKARKGGASEKKE